jgi:hypothetical protein
VPRPEPLSVTRRAVRLGLSGVLAGLLAGMTVAPVAAVDGLTMEAHALLDGHARIGTWMAVEVHLKNDGPPITGELRVAGGTQGQTRFGMAADLPTQSDKTFRIYTQPPAFGRDVEVSLVDGTSVIAKTKATFTLHDPTQLVVGIVAERPGDIVGSLDLLPNANNVAALALPLNPEDLPDRLEAWGTLDRLVWQDVDSSLLSKEQLAALKGWIAAGGRLVIAGGTAGPASLSAFPDAVLPYRPTTTTDVAPSALVPLLGDLPAEAKDAPALSGPLGGGRALVTVGDQVVAAERTYGAGLVTIVGFDPTVSWITDTNLSESLWRRLLPARASGGPIFTDDSQIVQAAAQLPSLALPPIGGLALLLGAYILLIGPINYFVLRRLDRREWAWVTMPVLIAAFAAGAYGFGSALRGSELIVNEVAIVRGSPGATEGSAQVYLGVFSPSRGTYQLRVPGGALLSSPIAGETVNGSGTQAALDVLQGDPARVRGLEVGFGSLRTIRADTAMTVPLIQADLRLEEGRLKGTITNASTQSLQKPAVVLGGTVASLPDLEPGQHLAVDQAVQQFQMGQQLSDKVVGPIFNGDTSQLGDEAGRLFARHTIIDQLTYDPNFGFSGQLSAEGPVILAWSDQDLLAVEIEGQQPRRLGNVLYYLPTELAVRGTATFRNDLMRATIVQTDAGFFNKDPFSINFGRGSATMAYRPVALKGTIEATELALALNFGGDPSAGVEKTPLQPLAEVPEPCPDPPTPACQANFDGLPEVDLYDLSDATWKRFPHLGGGARYAIAQPDHYVDPASGTVLVRFVNDRSDQVGFTLDIALTGNVK